MTQSETHMFRILIHSVGRVTSAMGSCCSAIIFKQRTLAFPTDAARVNYVIELFRGRALAWAEAINLSVPLRSLSFKEFETTYKLVFDHPSYAYTASNCLLILQHGYRSLADYSVEYWTLAAEAGWNT